MKESQFYRVYIPHVLEKAQKILSQGIKFIHYTSAEAAMNIIRTEEVWLRNAKCMNDFSEVEHGITCLVQSLTMEEAGKKFRNYIDKLFPDLYKSLAELFDSWQPVFRSDTYIVCVSEHHSSDDLYGKLSMWRAYGGKNPVALVVNSNPLLAESNAFNAFSYPVDYVDPQNFGIQLDNLRERLEANADQIQDQGRVNLVNSLFSVFRAIALCTKHPGFSEEREWRVVHNPIFGSSNRVKQEIEVIDGIPQEVCKIPLKDFPDENFVGATIPDFIDKIIIGPTDHQLVTGRAFTKLLKEAGCENAENRIRYSGIPLR